MTKHYNISHKKIITDNNLSHQNENEHLMSQIVQSNSKLLKMFAEKIEESSKISKQLSGVNNKIAEHREKLQLLDEKIESELQTIQTEHSCLESINNECRLLEVEENELKAIISQSKVKLTQVLKEKKGKMKKMKREIDSFKAGVNMYKTFLLMDINVDDKNKNSIINITLKNLNTDSNYFIVLEENDKIFKLIDIKPHSPSIIKAATLYNQNTDIQGLLAFLSDNKE